MLKLILVSMFLPLLAACGGGVHWDMVSRVESESRHNIQWSTGPRATFRDGTSVQILGGHRHRVEEPSIRGESEEWQVAAEVVIPLN